QIAGPGAGQPNLDELGAPTDLVMTNGRSAVPPSEGNEVRRDGLQGASASRSTDEVGEPDRRDPLPLGVGFDPGKKVGVGRGVARTS
ncbi:MAG: hypothetical protein ACJAQZ_004489, partial [Planctomycetota bacterium]